MRVWPASQQRPLVLDSVAAEGHDSQGPLPGPFAPRQAGPYGLWSLLDMLRFAAHSFVNMCVALADVERVAQQRQGDVVGPDFDTMEGNLRTIIERCRTVSGMPQSVT